MMQAVKKNKLNDSSTWVRALLAFVLISALIAIIPVTWQYAKETFQPAEKWFLYHYVNPVKSVFKIGEPLYFVSRRQVNRRVNFEWEDILFCNLEYIDSWDKYVYFSAYTTSKRNIEPHEVQNFTWRYTEEIPQTNAECYLRSTIIAKMKYGPDKIQTIMGNEFKIEG